MHKLNSKWTFWAHLPHDTDWSLKSYKKIMTLDTVEDVISLINKLPNKMVENCMLFIMREGIQPTWEDERNRDGGCFSYKVSNKIAVKTWRELSYLLTGETLTVKLKNSQIINGITISPKRNFCIIKVWTSTCDEKNPGILKEIKPGIMRQGCIFKRHQPEY